MNVRAEATAPAQAREPARAPKTVATAPKPAPKAAPADAFSDGPPLEDLEMPGDLTDATPPEFRGETPEPVERVKVSVPGDADFDAALESLPEPLRASLEKNFRAKFTELGGVDEARMILAGGKTGRAAAASLEDEISPDAPPVSE